MALGMHMSSVRDPLEPSRRLVADVAAYPSREQLMHRMQVGGKVGDGGGNGWRGSGECVARDAAALTSRTQVMRRMQVGGWGGGVWVVGWVLVGAVWGQPITGCRWVGGEVSSAIIMRPAPSSPPPLLSADKVAVQALGDDVKEVGGRCRK